MFPSKVVKDPNGTTRARRVPREKTRLQKNSKNIVAIDFGTKNCSVAYITENDQLEITRGIPKLPLNGSFVRVPMAVLFTPEGVVESFGHDARTIYLNLDDSERRQYIYFEEIKMNLHKDQVTTSRVGTVCVCRGGGGGVDSGGWTRGGGGIE